MLIRKGEMIVAPDALLERGSIAKADRKPADQHMPSAQICCGLMGPIPALHGRRRTRSPAPPTSPGTRFHPAAAR